MPRVDGGGKGAAMKPDLAGVESVLANSPLAVRVGVIVFASSLVFAVATLAGTSIGRAVYYLTHA
jgi:hypothetical protein